jgi:hypothetical protein
MRKRAKRRLVLDPKCNPVRRAVESVLPPGQKFVDKLRLEELTALQAFVDGRGDLSQWEFLARMVNASEWLGEHGCGPEAVPAAQRAAAGLVAAQQRHEQTRTWSLDGEAVVALREVREFMDLQFQSVSVEELEGHFAAIRREQERLRAEMA